MCEPQDTTFQSWLGGIADLRSTGTACSSFDYFVHEEYGGEPQDVDKTGDNDNKMCWNFSASNILDWTGWDKSSFDTAQAIAENVKANWENKGGMMKYLWRWWFDGTYPPQLGPEWSQLSKPAPIDPAADPKHDQNSQPWFDAKFSEYYYSHWSRNVMEAVKDYLHSGYGVAIRIYDQEESTDAVGHALTVWGYRYHADGTVIGLWVTDPDDAASEPPELRLLPVTYLANWIEPNLYELKWRVTEDDGDYPGWLIEGVQALKPRNANFLRVRKAGTGTGSVRGEGIECGEDCVWVPTPGPSQEGSTVTLTATPDDESDFVGWEGDCSGTGDCAVTVDGETQVTAIFTAQEPATFTITTDAESGATVYPTGEAHEVPVGEDAIFIFQPDNDYLIIDVLVDGYSVGPRTAYTFMDVNADHTLEVKTLDKDARLAIVWKKCLNEDGQEEACVPGENATIIVGDQQCDSECMRVVVPFKGGTAIILKAIPDEGEDFEITFEGWEAVDDEGEITVIDEENADRILYAAEDIFLRPIIRCNHN